MKKIVILSLIISFALSFRLQAQDCDYYFKLDEGTEMIVKSYDKKDNLTGWTKEVISKKESIEGGTAVTIYVESYTPDVDTAVSKKELRYECHNGIIFVDMNSYLNEQSLMAYQSMDVQVKSDNMELPSNLNTGDVLGNGNVDVTVYNAGVQMININVLVKNRKVLGEESLTTPAGTFDCYKISSDVETTMIFKINTSTIEWYSKDFGAVRTENYDKKGKLESYTVLESYTKP